MTRICIAAMFLSAFLCESQAWGATFYVSPTGSNSNSGSQAEPWLSFAHALDPSRAWCGDKLVLLDGTYGDGTPTGKIDLNGATCTAGNELTIAAQNQRKAKIVTNGTAWAVRVKESAYVTIDGLYARSADSQTAAGPGIPFGAYQSKHVTIRNTVARNVNRYENAPMYSVFESQDVLLEDNEAYIFHRHCVTGWKSERVVVRRQYCNPRGGRIAGGVAGPLGQADGLFSMYPCKDCILENSIQDGTTHGAFLNEMNATYGNNILMKGSKVLGSICYKCKTGNGIYLNARNNPGVNNTPHDITIRDVAFIDFDSKSAMVRVSDGMNVVVDHISGTSTVAAGQGISADDTSKGTGPSQNSITMTNSLVSGVTGNGFRVIGYDTWSGDKLVSYDNGTAFSPALPANWTNASTAAPEWGACKLWIPADSPLKGAGTNGSDIGANILYRTVDGMLTSDPLWDPTTGAFLHGAEDVDGTNRVVGESLFDIHTRLNVNTQGCPFPADYASGDKQAPAAPSNLQIQ